MRKHFGVNEVTSAQFRKMKEHRNLEHDAIRSNPTTIRQCAKGILIQWCGAFANDDRSKLDAFEQEWGLSTKVCETREKAATYTLF